MNLLVKENFLIEFDKLNNIQKKIFLDSVKKLQKISTLQLNIDVNCLKIYQNLFEAYQAYSDFVRNTRNIDMQNNINACNA